MMKRTERVRRSALAVSVAAVALTGVAFAGAGGASASSRGSATLPRVPGASYFTTNTSSPGFYPGCPTTPLSSVSYVRAAQENLATSENDDPAFTGPRSGPKVKTGSGVYVAILEDDLSNAGDTEFGAAVEDIAKALGWKYQIFGGDGTQAPAETAFAQAVATHPTFVAASSLSIPDSFGVDELKLAAKEHIGITDRHGSAEPGTGASAGAPQIFWNIQPNTVEVGRLAGNCAVVAAAEFGKRAGIINDTQLGTPLTNTKSGAIAYGVSHYGGTVLKTESYNINEVPQLQPGYTAADLEHYGNKLTAFLSINDLYCDSTVPTLITRGVSQHGLPVCIGAGDGSAAAFTRIRTHDYQIATVPDEEVEQAFVAIDELNRWAHGLPPSTFNPGVHIATYQDVTNEDAFDPANGYKAIYAKSWGVSPSVAKQLESITTAVKSS